MNKTEILNRLDIPEFYKGFIPSLKVNGKPEALGLCPFHDDHDPSLSVNAEKGVAIVEGINFIKRHTRPSKNVGKGGIVEKEGPVAIGKIGLLTPDASKLTHAKIIKQGDEKNRVCTTTNEPLGRK